MNESNINPIIEVFETKLDQLIQSVQEIKETMHDNSVDIANIKISVNTLENKNEQFQKEIEEIKAKGESTKNWIMGIVGSLIVAGVCSIAAMIIK